MSIKFKVLGKKNPQDIAAPEKYYATSIANGETTLESLAEMIAYQCTLTDTDCYAVLRSLERNMLMELSQGRIVKLGHVGTFQVSVSANGQDLEEDVKATDIKKSRILFRPAKKLKQMLGTLSYQKAS